MFPRLRNLPKEEQEPFEVWLRGQTRPLIEGLPMEEQDAYFPWDYRVWRAGLPCSD